MAKELSTEIELDVALLFFLSLEEDIVIQCQNSKMCDYCQKYVAEKLYPLYWPSRFVVLKNKIAAGEHNIRFISLQNLDYDLGLRGMKFFIGPDHLIIDKLYGYGEYEPLIPTYFWPGSLT